MNADHSVTAKDFAIGVLSVTAAILLAALIAVSAFEPRPALGAAGTASAGHFAVSTAQIDENSDLLIVHHTTINRANCYVLNIVTQRIDLLETIDLNRLAKPSGRAPRPVAGEEAPAPEPRRQGGRGALPPQQP